jgi:hypothetical protein
MLSKFSDRAPLLVAQLVLSALVVGGCQEPPSSPAGDAGSAGVDAGPQPLELLEARVKRLENELAGLKSIVAAVEVAKAEPEVIDLAPEMNAVAKVLGVAVKRATVVVAAKERRREGDDVFVFGAGKRSAIVAIGAQCTRLPAANSLLAGTSMGSFSCIVSGEARKADGAVLGALNVSSQILGISVANALKATQSSGRDFRTTVKNELAVHLSPAFK